MSLSSSTTTISTTMRSQFSVWKTFKHHIPRFLLTVLVDVLLPLATFIYLHQYIKPVYALLVASSPPLMMVLIKAIWFRTFDALGFLVFLTFAITAIVAIVTRNPIILLLEKSLMTGLLSIIFGITLISCRCCSERFRWKPLAFYFYQDLVPTTRTDLGIPEDLFFSPLNGRIDRYTLLTDHFIESQKTAKEEIAQTYEWLYTYCSSFRYSCYIITSIWSIGFLIEFLARFTLIFVCSSINKIVIYGHLILSSVTAVLILSTIICITLERRYTIAFIDQWTQNHCSISERTSHRRRSSDFSSVMIHCHSNSVLTIDV